MNRPIKMSNPKNYNARHHCRPYEASQHKWAQHEGKCSIKFSSIGNTIKKQSTII